MKTEQIEILLAAYNGAPYIGEQIDSILRQTDDRWHLTVSDDGSTDGTDRILDEYAARYPEKIRRVRSGRHFGGAREHFMWLMEQCTSPYMAFSDQDDVFYPQKIGKMLDRMLAEEERLGKRTPVLVFSDQTVTDERLEPIAPSLMRYQKQYFECFDYRSILMQNVVTGGAMMINRALAQRAGRCADVSRTVMHDWWLAVVAARFGSIAYIDEPLSAYRQHGDNCVGAKDVGSVKHILNKLTHLDQIRGTLLRKKQQAAVFLETYRCEMSAEDLQFLTGMIRRRSGILFYARHRRQIHGFFRWAGMAFLG